MGLFNRNKKENEEQEFVLGGGITAEYDDALKYAARQLLKSRKEVLEDIEHPAEVLLKYRLFTEKSDALLDTLVFVYGKTPKQVADDVLKVLKEKMEG